MDKYNLITILGHTAGGKTSVAANLAYFLNTEIISADSRQVYKNMNLGTGKDYQDYMINGTQIPVHLIDLVFPGYKYNVFEYQKDFLSVYMNIIEKGKTPILCGGTGMYIEAVLKGYKLIQVPINQELRESLKDKPLEELSDILKSIKTLHNKSDIDTKKRTIRAIEIENYYKNHPLSETEYPEINSLIIGVNFDRDSRRNRISKRLKQRLNEGMIEEVKSLLDSGISSDDLIYYGLEYKYITEYLLGHISYNDMLTKLEIAIHQFAKRQMTWFRGMEKKGMKIHWIEGELPMKDKIKEIISYLS